MRKAAVFALMAIVFVGAVPAFGELQNITVGGSIQIRGNYWSSASAPDSISGRNPLFQPPWTASFRNVIGGNPMAGVRWLPAPGRQLVWSPVDWTEDGPSMAFVEQRTRLNVRADFTESVSAFIEFDAYHLWGEDFRSNYTTGVDMRGAAEVELYQSYIEANDMFGAPLRLRVGRQELSFGSGWLIGTNDAGSFITGLSFDAIRATYKTDLFSLDAFAAKLAENSPIEQDGDVDLYGLYGSYLGFEGMTLDAYYFLLRDSRSLADTYLGFVPELLEDVIGVDDYDATNLHTVGMRAAGMYCGLKFDAELAYQFGEADVYGPWFAGAGLLSPYGDDDAEFGNWGGNVLFAYGFPELKCAPEIFVGGAYFGGEDNRDLNFVEWLGAIACPYWSLDSSVNFNRMFSNTQYGDFVSVASHDCSNMWAVFGGVSASPTERLRVVLAGAYVQSLADYKTPWPTFNILGLRVSPLSYFSFLDESNSDDLCVELALKGVYTYSEDLTFECGYSHMFLSDGAAIGHFNVANGLLTQGGTDDDDADYFYFDTKIKF